MAKIHKNDGPDLPADPKERAHLIKGMVDPNQDPLEESNEDGELEDITIQPAANGYSVRTSHKTKTANGHDYHHKNHVFPDKHGVIAHLTKRLR